MNVKKLNLRKIGLLLVMSVGMLTMSCEKEDVEIDETEATTEKIKPVVEPITYKYTYDYQGQVYNEKQWENKLEVMNYPDVSMIGLNNVIYVFDSSDSAIQFENTELQAKMNAASAIEVTPKANEIGNAEVKFRIELFDLKNYSTSGARYSYYSTKTVRRMRTWWGWVYLENNDFQTDLPTSMRLKATSYRVSFLQGGSVRDFGNGTTTGNPIYLDMRVSLKPGLISDGTSPNISKTLYNQPDIQNRKVAQEADLGNVSWLLIGDWDNKFRSWRVQFR